MKKLFTLLCAAMACAGSLWASVGIDRLRYNLNSSDHTAELTYDSWEMAYEGMTEVVIPSEIIYENETYRVTSIGPNAFMNSMITSITIPNSIISIGESAFSYCIGLGTITIPNSVTSIGEYAFYGITNVNYSGTATGSPWGAKCVNGYTDGWMTYTDNTKTTLVSCSTEATGEIVIPNSVTSIKEEAFRNCEKITSITIPNGVQRIENYTFRDCRKLVSISLPNTLQSIGNGAFHDCVALESITLPESVTSVESNIFGNCYALKTPVFNSTIFVYLPPSYEGEYSVSAGTKIIADHAFNNCTKMTSIVIPNSVTTIGGGAFTGCKSLTSITIPEGITEIPAWTFYGCTGLTSITFPNNISKIGQAAFSECSGLKSIQLPATITEIATEAFYKCTNVYNVEVPSGVTTVGNTAFYRVLNVVYNGELTNAPWGAKCLNGYVDGAFVFTDEARTQLKACAGGLKGEAVMPETTTHITDQAFYMCDSITSVTVSKNVVGFGNDVFKDCKSLKSVVWNAKNCGDFTYNLTPFYRRSTSYYDNYDIRSQITSFVVGDEVEYIPAYVCYGLSKVEEAIVMNCHTTINTNAFTGCKYKINGVYNIELPDTVLCSSDELYLDGEKCPLAKSSTRRVWTRKYTTVEGCDSTISIGVTWKSTPTSITLTTRDEYDVLNSGSVTVSKVTGGSYDYYTINGEPANTLTGLSAGKYEIAFINKACADTIKKQVTIYRYGMRVNNMYYYLDDENHTAMLTFRGDRYGAYSAYNGDIVVPKSIVFNEQEYLVNGIGVRAFTTGNVKSLTLESETPIFIESDSDLPKTCPIYVPYGALSAYQAKSDWKKYNVHVINPKNANATIGVTSASFEFGNADEQKHITSCGVEGSEPTAGNVLDYVGLEPNSAYNNVVFYINTQEGDRDTIQYSFQTAALTLNTMESKAVASTTAILLAETNISEAETNCGFEWKRNDAPEDMPGTKVFSPVANGTMAGRLKNLKDDVYYKYRAFYQSAKGTMYYGGWKYIFTGDIAVEFDPILYTYSAVAVTENAAVIKGYALAGSEDFTEQGFEYWSVSRVSVASAPARMPAALGEKHTVTATGINMKVTLTDLDAGTIYKYRAYAKVGDQVLYGAEMSFTTQGTYVPPTYSITFLNWDNTTLLVLPVEENKMPVYNGETPVRPDDEEYTYTFTGWTPEIVAATEDATYKAVYTANNKPTGIDQTSQEPMVNTQKLLKDGQLLILRGDKTYTVTGQER